MSKEIVFRRLRPHLFVGFKRAHSRASTRSFASRGHVCANDKTHDVTHDYEKRVAQLEARKPLAQSYPRLAPTAARTRVSKGQLMLGYGDLRPGETCTDAQATRTISGRIRSVRAAGSKLLFIDIDCLGEPVQAVCQLGKLVEHDPTVTPQALKDLAKVARKGDVYSVVGQPHRTERGELSLLATELPSLLSPCLHQIPEALEDPETRARSRHIDMLVNPEATQTLRFRHHIESSMQHFFAVQNFVKVSTPILSAGAGGAAARPFDTKATELSGEKLNLRIAPELWLKRLIVGGLERVYEIGPAFRNEGVDATHNPEFNICEFYQAHATLQDLIGMTRSIIGSIQSTLDLAQANGQLTVDPAVTPMLDDEYWKEIEFIPTLEEKLDCKLPDLSDGDAQGKVSSILHEKDIPVPTNPTLPRLLDQLASHYLEPLSMEVPTFITHHPACMSPLSKHFTCPQTNQIVAARAELFIAGREYANMYEEENSPFEQRRKFEEQARLRQQDSEAMEVDEQYLEVLEWGMPPTGGWGCGVDRLVMLFSGRQRMSDVLAFGSLRNVVALGGKRR